MFITNENSSRYVIRDLLLRPVFFSAVTLGISIPLGILLIIREPFPPRRDAYTLIFIAVVAFIPGIVALFKVVLTTTTVDKQLRSVSVLKRRIVGSKYLVFRRDELSQSCLGFVVNDTTVMRRGRDIKQFGIQLVLASGDSIDVTEYLNIARNSSYETAKRAQEAVFGP